MSKPNSGKKSKTIWSVISVEQLAAAIVSLGDRINQLHHQTWRLNDDTKLSTSLWAQVIEKLGIEHTERRRQSLYNIWHLERHSIAKLVERELKIKNRNIIDGDAVDINRIEEVSVQEDNNANLRVSVW